jgi:hypothetical protein
MAPYKWHHPGDQWRSSLAPLVPFAMGGGGGTIGAIWMHHHWRQLIAIFTIIVAIGVLMARIQILSDLKN